MMRMTTHLSKIAAGLLACALVAGCHSGTGGRAGKVQLALVTNNTSDYWTIARKGVEDAEKEDPNISVQFVMSPDSTAATQKREVDDLLAKGVKGIAISPADPANQTAYLDDVAKKAVLITQDSDAPQSDRVCYIGTDNHAAGAQAGGLMKEALPQGGKIMLFVGKRDAQNAHDREAGIREALHGSNIQIIDVRTDDGNEGKAKSNAADTLVKYPDISGMMGLWGYNGPKILSALKDGGKVGKVKVVCFDDSDETLAGVKDGSIYATVVQQPYVFGHDGIQMLAQLIGGNKSGIPASKQKFIATKSVKLADVDAYKTKLDKLTGKS